MGKPEQLNSIGMGHTVNVAATGGGGAMKMRIKIETARGNKVGKLADVELHFEDGLLEGLKLIGFTVWRSRDGGVNVTYPARQYSVNGERRSFALLRPTDGDPMAQERIKNAIINAYEDALGA
jgi:hypothetical protein